LTAVWLTTVSTEGCTHTASPYRTQVWIPNPNRCINNYDRQYEKDVPIPCACTVYVAPQKRRWLAWTSKPAILFLSFSLSQTSTLIT
jgi:hypothetical protein